MIIKLLLLGGRVWTLFCAVRSEPVC